MNSYFSWFSLFHWRKLKRKKNRTERKKKREKEFIGWKKMKNRIIKNWKTAKEGAGYERLTYSVLGLRVWFKSPSVVKAMFSFRKNWNQFLILLLLENKRVHQNTSKQSHKILNIAISPPRPVQRPWLKSECEQNTVVCVMSSSTKKGKAAQVEFDNQTKGRRNYDYIPKKEADLSYIRIFINSCC